MRAEINVSFFQLFRTCEMGGTDEPDADRLCTRVLGFGSAALARPKSITLTTVSPFSSTSIRFAGFRSRCTRFCFAAAARAVPLAELSRALGNFQGAHYALCKHRQFLRR